MLKRLHIKFLLENCIVESINLNSSYRGNKQLGTELVSENFTPIQLSKKKSTTQTYRDLTSFKQKFPLQI